MSLYFVFALSHVPEHSGENVFWEKRAPTRTSDKERRDMKHKLKASQRIQMYTAPVYRSNALKAR